MPWASKKQQAWGNSPSGVKAMGAAKIHEFNQATKGHYDALPQRVTHHELLNRFKPPKRGK